MRAKKTISVDKELFSIPEAAVMLGISDKGLWTWVQKRYIASVKMGHFRKIRRKDIDKFIEERTTPARPVM